MKKQATRAVVFMQRDDLATPPGHKKKKHLPHIYNFNLLNEGLVLLKKMVEEFELDARLCFIDKTAFTQKELEALESPQSYNNKIKKALDALSVNLPTFALIDEGMVEDEKLCLLVERGSFWGMGYLPKSFSISDCCDARRCRRS